jgi:hypothetical protein
MTFRTKMMSIIVALCLLSFLGGALIANAQDTATKVIGKATIKKGTELGGAVMVGPGMSKGFLFVAFEDTTVYLIEKVAPKEADAEGPAHNGGYLAESDGFPHTCPVHGREVMGPGIIGIPNDQIKASNGAITITLFGDGA